MVFQWYWRCLNVPLPPHFQSTPSHIWELLWIHFCVLCREKEYKYWYKISCWISQVHLWINSTAHSFVYAWE